jgi:hypothetical protein
LYIEKYIGVYLILPQGWKNSPPIFELQCSTRNVSNVLTEDQCKWLSTKWFIPLKERTQWLHNEYYESLLLYYSTIDSNNFLTQLAADPPSSHPEWVLPHLSSCFPHLCLVPTDSFSWSEAGWAPQPLLSVDRFQEALDPGNRPFLCRANADHLIFSKKLIF